MNRPRPRPVPAALEVADMNGNDIPDLIAANQRGRDVGVLVGRRVVTG
jgi:hypothetical protein